MHADIKRMLFLIALWFVLIVPGCSGGGGSGSNNNSNGGGNPPPQGQTSPMWNPVVQLGANTGYVDINNRNAVRTSAGVVYLVSINTPQTSNSGGQVQIFKGATSGSPTSFALMDAGHEPNCAFRASAAEVRMAGDNVAQVAFDCGTSSSAGYAGYVQFNTATDTWGTIETVGSYSNPNIRRYESKLAMAVDAHGKPHVIWGPYGGTTYYSNKVSATWSTAFGFNNGNWRASVQFDSAGDLHIAMLGDTSMPYYQRTAAGTWIGPETIASTSDDYDSGGGLVDSGPSLVIDKQGRPNVSWTGAEPNVYTYIRRRNGTTWESVTMPNGAGTVSGHSPSLNVDTAGNLYVILGHQGPGTLQTNLQPHVQWRNELTQSWDSTFAALATTPPGPDRDGGGGGRYDAIWRGSTNDLDYVTMVEDPNGGGQLAYIHGTSAVLSSSGAAGPGFSTAVTARFLPIWGLVITPGIVLCGVIYRSRVVGKILRSAKAEIPKHIA